ncbi:MAG: ParA family protein, partial [Holophagales bacterium]|nr:ParA family protein [Holophagales bacterium]
ILGGEGARYDFQVIACSNLRGGIGKTTCAVSLASRAAQYGFRTCLLDLDAQGSASLAFDRSPEDGEPVFYDIWQKPAEMTASALRRISEFLHILPSSLENGLLDVSLVNPAAQKNAVRHVCAQLKEEGFDLVVVDCPPSLGAAVISTICAAHLVVVPLWNDTFSFKGLQLTLEEIDSICETFNMEPPEIRLLYTRHDKREKLSARALEELHTTYADIFVPEVIPTSTEFSRALARRRTIFATRRNTPARRAYDGFVRRILALDERNP